MRNKMVEKETIKKYLKKNVQLEACLIIVEFIQAKFRWHQKSVTENITVFGCEDVIIS